MAASESTPQITFHLFSRTIPLPQPKTEDIVQTLFSKISEDIDNEQEIVEMLKTLANSSTDDTRLKKIVNTTYKNHLEEDESMLMWAVWRFKKHVVVQLLELGADPNYKNRAFNSVSTYWDISNYEKKQIPEDKQQLALEIATILHKKGVDLSGSGFHCKSVVDDSKIWGWNILYDGLVALGYTDNDNNDY